MKRSVRKELSEMVYKFGSDKDAAGNVYEALKKMGIMVDISWDGRLHNVPYNFKVLAHFDPEDIQTPILQHNIKVILSRYEYALQGKISWWKRFLNFLKNIF